MAGSLQPWVVDSFQYHCKLEHSTAAAAAATNNPIPTSHRTFMGKITASTSIATTALTFGMMTDLDTTLNTNTNTNTKNDNYHGSECECEICTKQQKSVQQHGMLCNCTSCQPPPPSLSKYNSWYGQPPSAMAYETKDDNGTKRSSDYYAQVLQVCCVGYIYMFLFFL